MKRSNNPHAINSFANLVFYPMQVPNTGCIATGVLSSGFDIVVTGGNTGQAADGVDTYLVEITDKSNRESPRVVTKKNVSTDDLRGIIEHHYKSRFRRKRRYNKR